MIKWFGLKYLRILRIDLMKLIICMIFYDIMIWFEMLENFEDWFEEVNNLYDMIMLWGLYF